MADKYMGELRGKCWKRGGGGDHCKAFQSHCVKNFTLAYLCVSPVSSRKREAKI